MNIIPFPPRKLPINTSRPPAKNPPTADVIAAAIAASAAMNHGEPSFQAASQPEPSTPQPYTLGQGRAAVSCLLAGNFIGAQQAAFVRTLMQGEEGQWFIDKMIALHKLTEDMPVTYSQDGVKDPTVYLHYFQGNYDGYITEKDKGDPDYAPEERQWQAYGWARFDFNPDGELGYICLPEILQAGAELDFHFDPQPLSQVKAKYGIPTGEPSFQAATQPEPPVPEPTPEPSKFQTPPPNPQSSAPPTDMRRIKERLAKLLRLGEDSAASEGEIENALRIATELMARHQIDRSDIDTESMDPAARVAIGSHVAFCRGRHSTPWEEWLASFVCQFIPTVKNYRQKNIPLSRNGIALLDPDTGQQRIGTLFNFYGADDDAQVAAEMFTEIRDDVARMAILRYGGWARSEGANYALGFVTAIREQHTAAKLNLKDSGSSALILLSEKTSLAIRSKADEWLATQGKRIVNRKKRKIYVDPEAYVKGKNDGANYNPSRPTPTRKLT